jgi:hypothetical protein
VQLLTWQCPISSDGACMSPNDELITALSTATQIAQPSDGALEAAAELPLRLTREMLPFGVLVTRLAVARLREKVAVEPELVPNLAAMMILLSIRLGDARQRQDALEAARESAALWRDLISGDRSAYLAGFAAAMSTLAGRLSQAGLDEEAIEAARDAVSTSREVADAEVGDSGSLAVLAETLNNLAALLAEVGKHVEALDAVQQAVEILTKLVDVDRSRHLSSLAGAVNVLANELADAGLREDALRAAREAVRLAREQYEADHEAYRPRLSTAVHTLANQMADAGLREDALSAAHEAVALTRELVAADPEAYLPDLAGSVDNLGNRLAEAGQAKEALEAAREAVSLRRHLADADPDIYCADLAAAVNNLGNRLSEVGRYSEAYEATRESVAIRRKLAAANPAAHSPGLASSLLNLGVRLAETERHEAALEATSEAVNLYADLAGANRDAYLPGLATSVSNLANRLAKVGRPGDALEAAEQAATIRRELAAANPDAYLPDFAASLSNLANRLAVAGMKDDALNTSRETVAVYRTLATANPSVHRPRLAGAIGNQATHAANAGLQDEALRAAQESVDLYSDLAENEPATYLPNLALITDNLATLLSQANGSEEAEALYDGLIRRFQNNLLAVGHLLFARARRRHEDGRLSDAVFDLTEAADALRRASDNITFGKVRQFLRQIRAGQVQAFDELWDSLGASMPVWLQYPVADEQISRLLVHWIDTSDWQESKAYFCEHTSTLMTDQAEAALEHLLDSNPSVKAIPRHLTLMRKARAHGPDDAYAELERWLFGEQATLVFTDWIARTTWPGSKSFAMEHEDMLLHAVTAAIVDNIGNLDPGSYKLRLHRGILSYAAAAGFESAYDFCLDPQRIGDVLAGAAPEMAVAEVLALARMYSVLSSDDPEAHYALAAQALLAGNLKEAAAALSDCADHAAPFERKDFSRRIAHLGEQQPELKQAIEELSLILT